MKLSFAAPESAFPFLSIALGSQASLTHFVMKLLNAAPASGLPSFPIALLRQLSSAAAPPITDPSVRAATRTAKSIVLMRLSSSKPFERATVIRNRTDLAIMSQSPCFPGPMNESLNYVPVVLRDCAFCSVRSHADLRSERPLAYSHAVERWGSPPVTSTGSEFPEWPLSAHLPPSHPSE